MAQKLPGMEQIIVYSYKKGDLPDSVLHPCKLISSDGKTLYFEFRNKTENTDLSISSRVTNGIYVLNLENGKGRKYPTDCKVIGDFIVLNNNLYFKGEKNDIEQIPGVEDNDSNLYSQITQNQIYSLNLETGKCSNCKIRVRYNKKICTPVRFYDISIYNEKMYFRCNFPGIYEYDLNVPKSERIPYPYFSRLGKNKFLYYDSILETHRLYIISISDNSNEYFEPRDPELYSGKKELIHIMNPDPRSYTYVINIAPNIPAGFIPGKPFVLYQTQEFTDFEMSEMMIKLNLYDVKRNNVYVLDEQLTMKEDLVFPKKTTIGAFFE